MQCPKCGTELSAADADIGRQGKCATCGTLFAITPPTSTPQPDAVPVGPPTQAPRTMVPVSGQVPGKVQAIGIMMLVGGIVALLVAIGFMASVVGLVWLPWIYSLVLGIMAIVRASKLLNERPYRGPSPQTIAIMQMVNLIACDCINFVLGIIILVFLADEEVARYFGQPSPPVQQQQTSEV